MKASVTEKAGGFNFKKAFIVFFAALLAFIAIATIFQAANGGWETAVNVQNSRFEARSSGDISSLLELRVSRGANGAYARNPGDRVLNGFAGLSTRMNMTEFNVFTVFSILFTLAFWVLVITWVYAKVQNRKKKKLQQES